MNFDSSNDEYVYDQNKDNQLSLNYKRGKVACSYYNVLMRNDADLPE